jgi:hypothetical protein
MCPLFTTGRWCPLHVRQRAGLTEISTKCSRLLEAQVAFEKLQAVRQTRDQWLITNRRILETTETVRAITYNRRKLHLKSQLHLKSNVCHISATFTIQYLLLIMAKLRVSGIHMSLGNVRYKLTVEYTRCTLYLQHSFLP